jgi:hypothetical protein
MSRHGSAVTFKGWGLDWALDLFDTYTAYSSVANSQLHSAALSLLHTVCRSQSPLDLLSHISPLVPVSKGGRSTSWVPKLSPTHSQCGSQCAFHLEMTLIFWSSAQ